MFRPQSLSRIPIVLGVCFALGLALGLSPAIPAFPQSSAKPASPPPQNQNASAPTKPAKAAFKPDPKKAQAAYKQGLRFEHEGDWQGAYDAYSDALDWAPTEQEYFQRAELAKAHLVQEKMDLAEREAISGRLSEALRVLVSVRSLDPSNRVLQARYAELSALYLGRVKSEATRQDLAGPVHLEYAPGKRNFNIRGDTQTAYNEIARQFGVEVAFDVDLRPRQVRFHIDDLDFPTALRILGEETGTFWRPLTKHLFLVAEDTAQKRKDYQLSVVRTVLLPSSESNEQMTEVFRLVREIAGITRADLDTRSGTITMRASPQAIAVATGLIDDLENPVGELVLEIEVLEVDRNYARAVDDGFHTQPPTGAGSAAIATGIDRRYHATLRNAGVPRRIDVDSNRIAPGLGASRNRIADSSPRRIRRRLNDFPRDGAGRVRDILRDAVTRPHRAPHPVAC
jgi:hypothetical protein